MESAVNLKIVEVVKETEDAISIHFKQPFLKKIKYVPGQFLTLLTEIEGRIERRCYSINTAPKVDSTISVTVKRIKDGKVSNHLYNTVKKGDSMKVLKPMGGFTLEPNPKLSRDIVLFGAGSGITPLMSMAKSTLYNEKKSRVSLFYGNRDVESVIFNEQLSALKTEFNGRLNLVHILENPGDFEGCYKGRVERSQVRNLLEQIPDLKKVDAEYFICGPSGMMKEAEEGLKSYGVSEEKIHIEKFTAPPPSAGETKASGAMLETREVSITLKGKEHLVSVKPNKTILDAALDNKVNIPYVCMDGICGSCKAKCTSGEIQMRSGSILSKKDEEAGYVLTCLSKPLTNNVKLEV